MLSVKDFWRYDIAEHFVGHQCLFVKRSAVRIHRELISIESKAYNSYADILAVMIDRNSSTWYQGRRWQTIRSQGGPVISLGSH
jgi:hypothetical protein